MKNIIALSVVLFTLVGGSVSAFAGDVSPFGINNPEAPQNTFGIQYPETFDNAHGITYPELP
ncbi:hypothetical protein NBRC116602_13700 [Hyphomicrobiales bacterium 4NK60-0047b]|jgi:hypothetical protein